MAEDFKNDAERDTKQTAMKARNEVTQDASRIRQWAIVRTLEHEIAHVAERQLAHQQEREGRTLPDIYEQARVQEEFRTKPFDVTNPNNTLHFPRHEIDQKTWEKSKEFMRQYEERHGIDER